MFSWCDEKWMKIEEWCLWAKKKGRAKDGWILNGLIQLISWCVFPLQILKNMFFCFLLINDSSILIKFIFIQLFAFFLSVLIMIPPIFSILKGQQKQTIIMTFFLFPILHNAKISELFLLLISQYIYTYGYRTADGRLTKRISVRWITRARVTNIAFWPRIRTSLPYFWSHCWLSNFLFI